MRAGISILTMAKFTVQITNASADADGQAATMIVTKENERRTALNEADPPADPQLEMLPLTPIATLKASYAEVLGDVILAGAHESYINQAAKQSDSDLNIKARWAASSDAQRQAAAAALASIS